MECKKQESFTRASSHLERKIHSTAKPSNRSTSPRPVTGSSILAHFFNVQSFCMLLLNKKYRTDLFLFSWHRPSSFLIFRIQQNYLGWTTAGIICDRTASEALGTGHLRKEAKRFMQFPRYSLRKTRRIIRSTARNHLERVLLKPLWTRYFARSSDSISILKRSWNEVVLVLRKRPGESPDE